MLHLFVSFVQFVFEKIKGKSRKNAKSKASSRLCAAAYHTNIFAFLCDFR